MAKILHFVAPNGCCTHPQSAHHDETGRLLSGQEVLAHLTGPKSVYELSKGAESMAELVKMVTAIINAQLVLPPELGVRQPPNTVSATATPAITTADTRRIRKAVVMARRT